MSVGRVHCACRGGCGAQIAYVVEPNETTLRVERLGLYAFKDGHLCDACGAAVDRALANVRALAPRADAEVFVADAQSGDVIRRATRADILAAAKGKDGLFKADRSRNHRDVYLVHVTEEPNGNRYALGLSDAEIANLAGAL